VIKSTELRWQSDYRFAPGFPALRATATLPSAGPDCEPAQAAGYECQIMSATVLFAGMNGSTCSV